MNAKEYLKQYLKIEADIKYLEEQIAWAEEEADTIRSTSDNDGQPHGSNIGHPTEDKAIKLSDKKRAWMKAREDRLLIRMDIIDTLIQLPPAERAVLHYRYIEDLTWENICVKVGYAWTQTHEYHKRGLKAVQTFLDNSE